MSYYDDLDDGTGYPHLDPPELNSGKPDNIHWIGEDRAVIVRERDYESMTRGFNYPFDEEIDYDPRIDNIDEEL